MPKRTSLQWYKMLYALCNIQEMAYHRDCDRSDANIMHFYPKTLELVFGLPYHSVYNNNNINFISGQYPNGANEAVFTIIIYIGIQNKTTHLFSAPPY